MADSIREKIMLNVKSTLEGITTLAGYQVQVQKVVKDWALTNLNIDTYPTIIIIPDAEPKKQSPVEHYTCNLNLALECYVNAQSDISSQVNILLADVEKALMADHTRGGFAIDTTLTGNNAFYSVVDTPRAGVIITIRIDYQHKYNSPYSQ